MVVKILLRNEKLSLEKWSRSNSRCLVLGEEKEVTPRLEERKVTDKMAQW